MPLKTPPVPIDVIPTSLARAIITTSWNGHGYRPLTVMRVESYYCETSLDNDSDPWHLEIGDPDGDYLDTLERNNEVRVKIFGVAGRNGTLPRITGIADEVSYSTDGTLILTGRDLSSLAVDSTVPPKTYRQKRAWAIVQEQARELGFTDTQLAKSGPEGNMVRKLLQTDGSESYWEFWYRLYRREKMWLWTEPDGTLLGDRLNYSGDPLYYFGVPRKRDPISRNAYYIPVERLEITKTTQGRVGEVWVYGQRGDQPVPPAFVKDATMKNWLKKPRKIMLDAEARTNKAARKTALEEIFEGKVGSIELRLTIADPGFEIEQNQVCVLNLPDPGISGEYFVVGVRRQVGQDGFVQEVRLREKQYAVTNRTPADPVIKKSGGTADEYATSSLGEQLGQGVQAPQEWMAYFIKAANTFHGPWDYNLFLATLLGICQQETHFHNVRSSGHPGGSEPWYPWEPAGAHTVGGVPKGTSGIIDKFGRTKERWQTMFANENYDGVQDIAVGPMQLLSRNLKHNADNAMKNGYHDQYNGGRWVPEYNIMEGARYFRECLKITVKDSGRDIDIWMGVAGYHLGPYAGNSALLADPYWKAVRGFVNTDPGFLGIIANARTASQANIAADTDNPLVNVGNPSTGGAAGGVNSAVALRQLSHLSWGTNVDVTHVNYTLLSKTNSLAAALGKTIVITSGWRPIGKPSDGPGAAGNYGGALGGDTQWYLWNVYVASGHSQAHIAAYPGSSNHNIGEALDCTVGGQSIKKAVSSSLLAQYGLHGTVDGDWPHITLLSVTG